ncbi:SymE family type I addiction module toxin [Snodgrassella alvi]|uniref:SymE family type I addiction module toxin n=1 Tax=Snodgrassella alvi TaxID=1196083 RepID=UPI000A017602|nr:SymE family type I addiction module toxin [Snodgrassella alvi]ORF41858.1 hypothetical protein BGI12_00170 [Snodgrassella alvi]PXY98825.1 type I addiction module toxin, SymE family [Snodgrassella alvi]
MAEHNSPEVTFPKHNAILKSAMSVFSAPIVKPNSLPDTRTGLCLKGDWLAEAGFKTGRGVTVKISDKCIVLMVKSNQMQELREQLYQAKQVVKGI